MAKNNDKYKEINNIINDTMSECFTYILKFALMVKEDVLGKQNFGSIDDNKFSIAVSKNGNLSLLQDISNLMQSAIDEYARFYKDGLKRSRTWLGMPVLNKPVSYAELDFNLNDIKKFIEGIEFKDETDKQNLLDCEKVLEIFNDHFGKINCSKLSNAKFYNEMIELKNELSAITVDKIVDAEIETMPDSLPECIDGKIVEHEEDEDNEEETESDNEEEKNIIPDEIIEHTKTTGEKIGDIIANIDKDGVEEQLKKIANMAKQTEDEFEEFITKKDENGNSTGDKLSLSKEWNGTNDLLKDFGNDPLALMWEYHYLASKKYESFIKFNQDLFFNFLLEDENEPEDSKSEFIAEIKNEIQKLPELFKIDSVNEFVEKYKQFANSINEKIKTVLDSENASDEIKSKLEELKDDSIFYRAVKFYKIISAKEEKPENTENEENTENSEHEENTENQNKNESTFHQSFIAALSKV